MTIHIQDIALSKLLPSTANVRRTGRSERIDELAASIAAHGLLQNLTVRPADKDRFEVVAGGRRLAALKLLAKRKAWAKNAPIPCQIIESDNATEISLAENALQCAMHPADQFEAFAALHRQDMSVENIAARFGVTPKIVTQRLKLGAVSPALMDTYRADEMNLDQLSAFAITDDHALQERVWRELGYHRSRHAILQALNEDQVPSDDRRALYVGIEAYLAAGGTILRDLFDEEDGGFLSDAALLNRLVSDKLAIDAEAVAAEGWKWVAVEPVFDYGLAADMRCIYPAPRDLTEADEDRIVALTVRYDGLCDEAEDEDASPAIQAQLNAIDREIEDLRGDKVYAPEDKAMAGAFVSVGHQGGLRIERGYIRREDDPRQETSPDRAPDTAADKVAKTNLPAPLIAELTAYRTVALGNELAQQPGLALAAIVHNLAGQIFYSHGDKISCLKIEVRKDGVIGYDKDIRDNRAVLATDARHAAWQGRIPEEPAGLWDFIRALAQDEQLNLLAHCASLTVDAILRPNAFDVGGIRQSADALAAALALDMTDYWQPTAAGYFGRVSKAKILEAVREGASPDHAQALKGLKKPAMAERAERLLADKGWLPEVLRHATA